MQIDKSPEDKRKYKHLTLKNGLRAILVSDPETEKASAALRVGIGSFNESKELPGLAHFLEHMLFLGTKTFPEEGFFEHFLQKNSGTTNAETDDECTSFYFDVHHSALSEALFKFASFFICPLLRRESSGREINAIQSEFEMNFQLDIWRLHQLSNHLTCPENALNRFTIGNVKTLLEEPAAKNIDLFEEVKKFYEKHYSSHLMTLAVLGKEPLEVLAQYAEDYFEAIERKNFQPEKIEILPFGEPFMKSCVKVESVKNLENLNLQWVMPPTRKDYKSKPHVLVSQLIGHEGKGSLVSFLKKQNLATCLSSGTFLSCDGVYIFQVKIKLTSKGVSDQLNVLLAVFQYLKMLRQIEEPAWKRLYEEFSLIEQTEFTFKPKEKPIEYARSLSESLTFYGDKDVLTGGYLISEFDFGKISSFVQNLAIDNFRYFNLSQTALKNTPPTNIQTEPHFKTRFSLERIPPATLQSLLSAPSRPDLAPPPANEFIARDFAILCDRTSRDQALDSPRKVRETDLVECFHKLDFAFKKPSAFVILRVLSPLCYSTPANAVLSHVFIRYLHLFLAEDFYPASVAGISFSAHFDKKGLTIQIYGYNEMLPRMFRTVLEKVAVCECDEGLFEGAKEMVRRQISSFDVMQSYRQANFNSNWLVEKVHWHNDRLKPLVGDLSVKDLNEFVGRVFKKTFAQIYVAGNIGVDVALELCAEYEDFCKLQNSRPIGERVCWKGKFGCANFHSLSKPLVYLPETRNAKEPNSSVVVLFQIGAKDNKTFALSKLLETVCSDDLYKKLRTEENLGYMTSSWIKESANFLHFNVLVQGVHHPLYVYQRIIAALTAIRLHASNSPKSFEKYRSALINSVSKKDETLKEEVDRFWKEMYWEQYEFDRKKHVVENIKSATLEEFLDFFSKVVFDKQSPRIISGVLNSQTVKSEGLREVSNENFEFIEDVELFKRENETGFYSVNAVE